LTSYTLSIAGFKILLTSEDLPGFSVEPSFLPFIVENDPIHYDIKISVVEKLSASPDILGDLVFESQDDTRKYFSVFQKDDVYRFIVYHPLEKSKVQQTALLKNNMSEWEICMNYNHTDITPLSYPMGSLILYYLTVKHNAIMIHASGIDDNGRGRLFSGFSGSGKSTMAGIWQQNGYTVLNDDRIMIRKEDAGYFMYNTPMILAEMPKRAPLNRIYLIEHSEYNCVERLRGVKAVSQVMAFCIQHGYNSAFLEHHLKFIAELCEEVSVCRLGFIPEDDTLDFIQAYEI
jgi:hypothetical protein